MAGHSQSFAPIEGAVIQTSDNWPDNTMVNLINTVFIWFRATFLFRPKINGSKIDIRPNVGNYVMIQSETGEIVFLAHMRSGSVKVVVGQRVAVGQIIGEVGNSGNTTAPHLHINLFDQMDNPLQAQVLPFVFRHYERKNGSALGNYPTRHSTKGRGSKIIVNGIFRIQGSNPRRFVIHF